MTTPLLRVSAILVATTVLLGLISLCIGQVFVPWSHVLAGLADASSSDGRIIVELRLPRVVAAICAGAAFGVGGLLMQTLFRNPLADPWALGLVAGGQLGVALVVTAAGFVGPSFLSFIGAFSGLSLVAGCALGILLVSTLIAAIARRVSVVTLLVFGLMLGYLAQGLISITLHFANRGQGGIFTAWNDGTFASITWPDFLIFLPVIGVGLLVALLLSKPLTALQLGETYAASLGVNVAWLRRAALAATILLAAPVTAYCGPVAFVGLIVPHLARGWLKSAEFLQLLPVSTLIGACLALTADFVVHLPWDQHFLHLNAVLAVIGAPVVMVVLLRLRSLRITTD